MSPATSLVRLTGATLTVVYFVHGIAWYGFRPFLAGVRLACVIAILQFIEVNFFRTRFLAPEFYTWRISPDLALNIRGGGGHSYDFSAITKTMARVSGTALEPGHFATLMFCLLGLVRLRSTTGLLVIAGAICSLSRVSLLLTPVLMIALLIDRLQRRWLAGFVGALFSIYFCGALWIANRFGGREEILDTNRSLYDRIDGIYAFIDIPAWTKLFGTGYQNTCMFLSDSFAAASNALIVPVGPGTDRMYCAVGALSGFSSFLLENGILGFFLLLAVIYVLSRRSGKKLDMRDWPTRQMGAIAFRAPVWYLVLFVISLPTIHYLTFFPLLYFVLATGIFLLMLGKRQTLTH
jgi:hypothetical protein